MDTGHFKTEKIFIIDGAVVGAAGMSYYCAQFFERMRNHDMTPFKLFDDDTHADASFEGLVLREEGLYFVDTTMNFDRIEDDFFAIGSGAMAARAAMMLGYGPVQAVKVAAKLDSATGLPVVSKRLPSTRCRKQQQENASAANKKSNSRT